MTITVHGGHAAEGNKFCGAAGYVSESVEDRKIKDAVKKWAATAGVKAIDTTVDTGASQGGIIAAIKKKINAQKADCNISVHLNAFTKSKKDGKTKGVEVLVYEKGTEAEQIAARVCKNIAALGFTNRGVKVRKDLGVLKGITNGGQNILVECFFCDDEDDTNLYKKVGTDAIGKAIMEGVLGKSIEAAEPAPSEFKVRVTANALNVRNKPSMQGTIIDVIRDKGVYTATEVSGNWLKIKERKGWISASYARKV